MIESRDRFKQLFAKVRYRRFLGCFALTSRSCNTYDARLNHCQQGRILPQRFIRNRIFCFNELKLSNPYIIQSLKHNINSIKLEVFEVWWSWKCSYSWLKSKLNFKITTPKYFKYFDILVSVCPIVAPALITPEQHVNQINDLLGIPNSIVVFNGVNRAVTGNYTIWSDIN